MRAEPIDLLIAEDDEDDYYLLEEAFKASQEAVRLHWVRDGEELIDYLLHQNQYQGSIDSPMPVMILLDLNMPKMDGREVLRELKTNPRLRTIPVVVLTTSGEIKDVEESYQAGASSYIRKPSNFGQFVEICKSLKTYWFKTVNLPHAPDLRDYTLDEQPLPLAAAQ